MKIRPAAPAALLAATVASAMLLSGCGGSDDAKADTAGGRVDVLAAFYPLKFVTQEVGGSHVKVTNLTKAGVEPHDLELTPKQVGSVTRADLVVYLEGLQPAVDEAIEQNKPKQSLEASSLSPLEEHGTEVHGAEEGDEHEDHGHEGEHTGDPHIWLDPSRLATIATGVGESLASIDPQNATDYRARVGDLVNRLNRLDGEFTAGLSTCARRDFVTSHAAFGYLAERYHLNQIAVNGMSPEAEPSPARRADIQKLAKERGITTVYFETLAEPKTAKTLAEDLNLQTAVLDPLEGIKDESHNDYFSVMRGNLDALRKGLGCS